MNKKNPHKLIKTRFKNLKEESSNNLKPLLKTDMFGVGVTRGNKQDILEYLMNFIEKTDKRMYIVTPNPEMIVRSSKNSDFKKALNQAQIALPDGIGLTLGAKFFGKKGIERVTGIEFMESVCREVTEKPITVGFLGGGIGVAEGVGECLKKRYPNLNVVFAGSELKQYSSNVKKNENHKLRYFEKASTFGVEFVNSIDILFIAFGFPKQELFMMENLGKLPVRVMVGVGGAFDQIVNPSLRPPKFIDNIGLGWFYRLIRQPWRIKRQLALIEFIGMVIEESIKFVKL